MGLFTIIIDIMSSCAVCQSFTKIAVNLLQREGGKIKLDRDEHVLVC